MLKRLKELVYMNRYPQLSANELEGLRENTNEIMLLPSSNDYGWFTSFLTGKKYVSNAEVITLGRARYANIKYCNGPFISANNHIIESKDQNLLRTKYLYRFLACTSKKYYVESTSYPKFEKEIFEDTVLEVPNISIQDKRIEELDFLNKAIKEENLRINMLDSLIKSRFNEMFSGSISHKPLILFCNDQPQYGAQSASCSYDGSRPRYVRITDINDDGTLNDDKVCSSNYSDDDEYLLNYGDFLFARTGATVGKTYVANKRKEIFAGYLIRFKLDLNRLLPEYLYWFTKTETYWDWVYLKASGAAQPGINAKKYSSLPIPDASLEKQKEFVAFVKRCDKLKFIHHFELVKSL